FRSQFPLRLSRRVAGRRQNIFLFFFLFFQFPEILPKFLQKFRLLLALSLFFLSGKRPPAQRGFCLLPVRVVRQSGNHFPRLFQKTAPFFTAVLFLRLRQRQIRLRFRGQLFLFFLKFFFLPPAFIQLFFRDIPVPFFPSAGRG